MYVSCWLGMRTWQCSQTPNLQIYTATCNCLPRNQNINQDQVAEPYIFGKLCIENILLAGEENMAVSHPHAVQKYTRSLFLGKL